MFYLNNEKFILLCKLYNDSDLLFKNLVQLPYLLTLSTLLFSMGLIGICLKKNKNIIFFMLCIEIILLSSVINFTVFSIFQGEPLGQIYALFIITLAACESALGLGLLIAAYRVKKSVNFRHFENLRG